MNKSPVNSNQIWESGFEGHADAQLLRLSKLTFRQKLEWLDASHKLLRKIQPHAPIRSHSPCNNPSH
jgi:hypothetical protein